jgi:hypothetical protein
MTESANAFADYVDEKRTVIRSDDALVRVTIQPSIASRLGSAEAAIPEDKLADLL